MVVPSFSTSIQDKIKKPLIMIVVFLLLLFFDSLKILQPVVTVGQTAIAPILNMQIKIAGTVAQSYRFFQGWQHTARRVQDLELRLNQASAVLGELELLKKENQQLRELLNTTDRGLNETIIVSPIVSMAQPAVGLPIGLSAQMQVKPGLAVLAQNTLVGIITSVKNNTAYIGLLWQKEVPFVLAQTQTGVQGLLVGDGKKVLLTEIPVDEEVEVGQRVITTGQEGIASGLFVGEIRSLHSGYSSATKTAVIEQFVSFYESSVVEIRLN